MAGVDQQRVRRTRTGLIAHDPTRALQGSTLFAPMFGDGTVYLVDMDGVVTHTWHLPHRPGAYGYLLDSGRLFYSGKVEDGVNRFPAWERFKAGAALEVDWNGKVAWEVRHPDHHHDARKLRNGNVILLCLRPVPRELRARIKGGLPGGEVDSTIHADYLLEVTTRGEVVWEWRSWEHLDFETELITPQDHREEWTHGNTVAELPDGNLVVSFRNISTVVIVERRTGAIVWKLGSPPLAQQHDPRPLPNGNLLIFD
ncbi:MAG: aryl-sulfate sulfotransferase, partial [Gemmatimonadales bacterium]